MADRPGSRKKNMRIHKEREGQIIFQSETRSLNCQRNTLEPHTNLTVLDVSAEQLLMARLRTDTELGGG